jgi:hypothetical protein
LIVLSTVVFDLSSGIPVVEVGDGATEGVVGGRGAIEQSIEPDWKRLGDIL